MVCNGDIPELVERYMEKSGGLLCWVTVNYIRTCFDPDKFAAPAIFRFSATDLQRIISFLSISDVTDW